MTETTEEASSETAVMHYCELSFYISVSMKTQQSVVTKKQESHD